MRFFKKHYIYILAILPILNLATTSIAIFVFFTLTFVYYDREESKKNIKYFSEWTIIFWMSLPLFLCLLSLIFKNNFISNLSFVERNLSFLIIPLAVFGGKPFKKIINVERFVKIYIFSSAILSLSVLVFIIITFLNTDIIFDLSNYHFVLKVREHIDKIPFVNEHPIYLSILLGTAIIFLFFYKFCNGYINLLIGIVLILGLLLASSRGPILALILVIVGIIFYKYRFKLKALGIVLCFLMVTIVIGITTPLKSRILEIRNIEHLYPKGEYYNSFTLRLGIYNCVSEIIMDTPWNGHGSGDVQIKLNDCYVSMYETDAYNKTTYNSHNQFFFYYLAFGPIGFTLIIISFIIFIKKAIHSKDGNYLFFLIFFYLCLLFENVLSRNTGIMVFTIFNSLFYFKSYLKE
ncbi:O-Antigen ligase [Maribacter sedimenticola]|uniref:O-Antigen ligase n=1 Tax=Maribacter sedimenticola TaxID=228956 RepID=A0ABY1SCT2_9FLAO|nr:O-antigen ligase family protein [Maribacter sedimenticola]SNR24574.1 O-Antigen ligase [Maribacter sedimenticola]